MTEHRDSEERTIVELQEQLSRTTVDLEFASKKLAKKTKDFEEAIAGKKLSEVEVARLLRETEELREEVVRLNGEVADLKEKLEKKIRQLENVQNEQVELEEQVEKLKTEIAKSEAAGNYARTKLADMEQMLKGMMNIANDGPYLRAHFLRMRSDGRADVYFQGHVRSIGVAPAVDKSKLTRGQTVIVNGPSQKMQQPGILILELVEDDVFAGGGEVCAFVSLVENNESIIIVATRNSEKQVVSVSGAIKASELKAGDHLILHTATNFVIGKVQNLEHGVSPYEARTKVTFADIGAQDDVIKEVRDSLLNPILFPDIYRAMGDQPVRNSKLVGPPGCGKSMIIQAIAHQLSEEIRIIEKKEATPVKLFMIKAASLGSKWLFESENRLMAVGEAAIAETEKGFRVIIFFDEADAMLKARGTGTSSDFADHFVPQWNSFIDKMLEYPEIFVFIATNRPDLIDEAATRDGRFDKEIFVKRPNTRRGAKSVMAKYLKAHMPFDPKYLVDEYAWYDWTAPREEWEPGKFGKKKIARLKSSPQRVRSFLINRMLDRLFYTGPAIYFRRPEDGKEFFVDNRYMECMSRKNEKRVYYYHDLINGAFLANIVKSGAQRAANECADARRVAVRNGVMSKEETEQKIVPGFKLKHALDIMDARFKSMANTPNTKHPEEWGKINFLQTDLVVDIHIIPYEEKVRVAKAQYQQSGFAEKEQDSSEGIKTFDYEE